MNAWAPRFRAGRPRRQPMNLNLFRLICSGHLLIIRHLPIFDIDVARFPYSYGDDINDNAELRTV